MIKLIVGLGNPGSKYEKTRHNAGFIILDEYAKSLSLSWKSQKGLYEFAKSEAGIALLKPLTYMNESGLAVRQYCDYHEIAPDEVVAVVDDFALPFGKLRLRKEGSSGGHNGLKSIEEHFGTVGFARLRFGIGPLPQFMDPADFVLSSFSKEEYSSLKERAAAAVLTLDNILKDGLDKAISKIK